MNKEDLIKRLLADTGDTEGDHFDCDEALLEFINDKDITEAYFHLGKWYA